ncbi:MAG: hypothetical protein QOJ98_2444, partial [Acidobacteriota bacterium]|nr:hypothetical protein [Acidobacteriota bacterium]
MVLHPLSPNFPTFSPELAATVSAMLPGVKKFITALCLAGTWITTGGAAQAAPQAEGVPQADSLALPNPVMFVGQVPTPFDFTTVASTFGNHDPHQTSAPRGGDLFILYPSGTLKNVTRTAGFGNAGFQGAASIAVREPSVHWSGTKALFSMVIGAPTQQFQVKTFFWQIYEVTNLG